MSISIRRPSGFLASLGVSLGNSCFTANCPINNINITNLKIAGGAQKLSLSLSKSYVYPSKTSGDSTALVTATLGGNAAGKTVMFRATPQDLSGGHNHSGGRPSGTFDSSFCITDVNGSCAVTYSASQIAGVDSISAFLAENTSEEDSKNLTVQVPSLVNFETVSAILNGTLLRFTGSNSSHPENHFLQPAEVGNTIGLANDIFDYYHATVGLNDMSLPQGGLFDIGPPKGLFWHSPHGFHREGKSIDIDRCALSVIANNPNAQNGCPTGWVGMNKVDLEVFCVAHSGFLVNEGPIHCEFY